MRHLDPKSPNNVVSSRPSGASEAFSRLSSSPALTRDDLKAINEFRQHCADSRVPDEFLNALGNDPKNFFSEEIQSHLLDLAAPLRVALLAHVTTAVSITPELVTTGYFSRFPQDAALVEALFRESSGRPQTQEESALLSASLPYLHSCGMAVEGALQKRFNAILEISARRSVAGDKLLSLPGRDFLDFGNPGRQLHASINEAWTVTATHSHVVDTASAFGEGYSALDPSTKSQLLQAMLVNLQYVMVTSDCYRSAIVQDDVLIANRNVRLGKPAPWAFAHSTVYGMEHPAVSYDSNLRFMIEPAFEQNSPLVLVDRFPLLRLTLRTLEEFAKLGPAVTLPATLRKANCDLIIDFWDKNRNPIFCSAIAEALTAQDSSYAASQLLGHIRNQSGYRTHLASLLYRIELGKLQISDEGVRYLEKVYDLQQFNRPEYFVQRLTAQGEIGIFDQNDRLIRYFGLGDLASAERTMQPELLEFTVQTLFFAANDANIDAKDRRTQWLDQFQENYLKSFSQKFLENTGVRFNNFSFREQGGYVHFIATATAEETERAQLLIRKFGEAGLRSFISLQFEEGLRSGIFALAEKLPFDFADEVFRKYSAIVEAVAQTESFCRDYFKTHTEITPEMVQAISFDLLKTAKSLLTSAATVVEAAPDFEPDRHLNHVGVLLDALHERVALFASCFREVVRHTPLSYHDVKDCSLVAVVGSELTKDWVEQVRRIGNQRTLETYPDPAYASLVLGELHEALKSNDNTFYLVRFGAHLLSFCRSHALADEEALYIGSLNSNPQTRGTKVGMTLIHDVTAELAKHKSLVMYVGPGREALVKLYVDELGFRRAETMDDGTVVLRRDRAD